MKKLFSALLLLIVFMASFTLSFANNLSGKVLLRENGRGQNYQVVNIKIGGTSIESEDVPPIIYPLNKEGRTLVPLRMIIDHFQDRLKAEISWDGAREEARVKTKDKEIILKINSPDARVNGVKKRLPDNIPAKLLADKDNNGRTMVPIRFFAEELGLEIGWDEKTNTALIDFPKDLEDREQEIGRKPDQQLQNPDTAGDGPGQVGTKPDNKEEEEKKEEKDKDEGEIVDISHIRVKTDGLPQIRIKTSKEIEFHEFKLSKPERLVIDLKDARFNLNDKSQLEANGTLNIRTDSKILKGVRASQFEKEPSYITRLVIDLGDSVDYDIAFNKRTGEIVIDFVNYIYNVKREILNAKEVISIEGDLVEAYNILELRDPDRIVVDIEGGVLHSSFKTRTYNVDGRLAKTIRISEFIPEGREEGKNVRIVIDLKEGLKEDLYVELEDNRLEIHLEGEPFKSIVYQELGWTTSKFELKGLRATSYDVDYQFHSNTIEISVPKKDIDLELMNLELEDHILKTIRIGEDPNNYNIQLYLQEGVEYRLPTERYLQDLVLELNNKNARYRELLIIVDPGHGGSDPGTISPILNLKESELVLDISLRLNKLLAEAGFRTYMTRVDNLNSGLKLNLEERTDVANALKADLFISVHANSFTNSGISGIETFYHPDDISGKGLAQVIQTSLINNLKMNDRGAKSANYFVLRNSNMPAALVETGFLSNPSDAAKLAREDYRQQVAEAIFEGIVQYLETRK